MIKYVLDLCEGNSSCSCILTIFIAAVDGAREQRSWNSRTRHTGLPKAVTKSAGFRFAWQSQQPNFGRYASSHRIRDWPLVNQAKISLHAEGNLRVESISGAARHRFRLSLTTWSICRSSGSSERSAQHIRADVAQQSRNDANWWPKTLWRSAYSVT